MEEEIKIYDDYTIEIPSNEIETDLNNNLKKSKDLKTLEKNDGIPYEKLDKEIRMQEESRKLSRDNISNFAKSQKPKKAKNKVLLWSALGAVIASAAVGGGLYLAKNPDTIKTYKYNRQIEKVYKEADETIKDKIFDTTALINANVDMIRIQEPKEDANFTNVFVYYSGNSFGLPSDEIRCFLDTYRTQVKYYNSLVSAEESGDMLSYISCLNEIFNNMRLVSKDQSYIQMSSYAGKIEDTKENQDKINDLFALDFENEDIIRQIGFLPTSMLDGTLKYSYNKENGEIKYTLKIGGISYCETKSESYDVISNGDGLVMTSDNYDSNHVKAYYREFEFSSSVSVESFNDFVGYRSFCEDVIKFLSGEKTKNDIKIKTVNFEETNVLDNFLEMRDGNFNFKLPDEEKESDTKTKTFVFEKDDIDILYSFTETKDGKLNCELADEETKTL